MKGIRLSEQHGLNPTINVCFFCGKDKELLFMGKLKKDAKAPKRVVANYKPCKDCEEKMRGGRTIIEVTKTDTGAPAIIEGAWPTGRWCVISREASDVLFKDHSYTPMLLEDFLYSELLVATQR